MANGIYSIFSGEVKKALNTKKGEVKRVPVKKELGLLYIPKKKYCKFDQNDFGPFLRFGRRSPDGGYVNVTVFNYDESYFDRKVLVFMEIYIKVDRTGRPHLAAKAVGVKKRIGKPKEIRIEPDFEKAKNADGETHFLVVKGKKSPVIVIE